MTDPKAQAVPGADPRVLRPPVPEQLRGRAARHGRRDADRARPGARAGRHGRAGAGRARRGRRRLAAARAGGHGRSGSAPGTRSSTTRSTPPRREPAADAGGAARLLGRPPRRGHERLDRRGGAARLLRAGQRHLADPLRSHVLRRRPAGAAAAGAAPGRDGRRRAVLRRLQGGALAAADPHGHLRGHADLRHPDRGGARGGTGARASTGGSGPPRRRPGARTGSTTPTCCSGCTAARWTRC